MRCSMWGSPSRGPRTVVVVALCLVSAGRALLAQGAADAQAADATVVRGIVVDARSDAPLRRVRVTATIAGTLVGGATSAADGTFLLSLPAAKDSVRVAAEKARYATAVVDVAVSSRPGIVAQLRVAMTPGGAISGRLVDASGSAPEAVVLPTLHRVGADGSLSPVSPAIVRMPTGMDPEGRFRFGGLLPGRYAVGVEVRALRGLNAPLAPIIVDVAAGEQIGDLELVADVRQLPALTSGLPGGSGAIRGRVSAHSGEPLAGATVFLSSRAGGSWRATTDALGRFVIEDLPAGTFSVTAFRTGYLLWSARDGGNPGRPFVVLGAGERADDVELSLARTAAISGSVVDEEGEPLQNVRVRVMPASQVGNNLTPTLDPQMSVATDDRGEFRLAGLTPGVYVVLASAPQEASDSSEVYVPIYFPGTRERSRAAPIRLEPAAHVSAIAMTLRTVPAGTVSGTALTAAGLPAIGTARLLVADERTGLFESRTVPVRPDGAFAFTGVPEGTYLIELTVAGPSGRELASEHVTITNVERPPMTLRTRPSARMTGKLVLEAAAGRWLQGYSTATTRLAGGLARSGASHMFSGPIADGTPFTMTDLWGPTRVQFASPDDTWYLKSVVINGVDAADEPFDFGIDGRSFDDVEVIFSPAASSLAGRALDERGLAAGGASVVVFPVDPARWFAGSRWIKSVTTEEAGAFAVKGLPPGEYYAVAIERPERGATPVTPEFLQEVVVRASRVTAPAGSESTTTLRLIRR